MVECKLCSQEIPDEKDESQCTRITAWHIESEPDVQWGEIGKKTIFMKHSLHKACWDILSYEEQLSIPVSWMDEVLANG